MKIEINYNKWYKLIILIIVILTLYYTIPKSELDIFFDPEKDTSSFTVSNVGDTPLTNVKIAYSLDCQKITYEPEYISKEVPILTQSNGLEPDYIHYLDNLTANIIKNSKDNTNVCINETYTNMFIPYSRFTLTDPYYNTSDIINFSKESSYNYNIWYCDQCNLNISVITNKKNESNKYSFSNPIKLNMTTFCLYTPEDSICYNKVHHEGPGNISNFIIPKQNYENSTGVIISTRE